MDEESNYNRVEKYISEIDMARELLYEGKIIQAEAFLAQVLMSLPSSLKIICQKADYWDETVQKNKSLTS